MYIIYDNTTKEYINIVKNLPADMRPGTAYKQVANDYDWRNSYIDDADALQVKTDLPYSFASGIFSTTATDDTLNITVTKFDDVIMVTTIKNFILDLIISTTLDLSEYIGYNYTCTSKKYKTVTTVVT